MINTFAGATSFDQDVSAWDIGNVDLMSGKLVGACVFRLLPVRL